MADQQIRVQQFDITTPIDIETAVAGLAGEPTLFYTMLGSLEGMTLTPIMTNFVEPYEAKQYKQMKELAHSLKGASGYIGASRLHYACYFIQAHYVCGRYEKMVEYYPTLVECAIEYKTFSRKIIAQNKGETYVPEPEHETCDVSPQFILKKCPQTNYIYCLRIGQTIADRQFEKDRQPKKPGDPEPEDLPPAQPKAANGRQVDQAAFESPRPSGSNELGGAGSQGQMPKDQPSQQQQQMQQDQQQKSLQQQKSQQMQKQQQQSELQRQQQAQQQAPQQNNNSQNRGQSQAVSMGMDQTGPRGGNGAQNSNNGGNNMYNNKQNQFQQNQNQNQQNANMASGPSGAGGNNGGGQQFQNNGKQQLQHYSAGGRHGQKKVTKQGVQNDPGFCNTGENQVVASSGCCSNSCNIF